MFSREHFYESKVFLRSYADAIETIKEAAWRAESFKKYEHTMDRIQELKEKNQIQLERDNVVKGPNFQNSREVRLFQFSNFVFKKYLTGFDEYHGDYIGLKTMLNEAVEKIKKDFEVVSSVSQ